MKKGHLFFWALTSALAGFLFGFDTVVISGAEQTIEELWKLSSGMHGAAISMALWGTVLGALLGGIPAERYGRKKTLLWIGILYFVSAVGSGLAPDVYSFMIARFIGGLGVGVSTVAAPMFISEIAPPKYRGRLAGMFQFNIVFGILVAFLSNYLLGGVGDHAWRWMLGVEAFPALIYTVMCLALPESPRWLISHKGDRKAGKAVFKAIDPSMSESDLDTLADEVASSHVSSEKHRMFSASLKVPIVLAFLIAFFNQLSGINAILYFAPRILELSGLTDPLRQSIGIGVTNLIFTFVGLYFIDKLGRRTLLYIGSFGYIISLGLCSWAFFAYAPQLELASKSLAVEALSERLDERAETEIYKEALPFIAVAQEGTDWGYDAMMAEAEELKAYDGTRAEANRRIQTLNDCKVLVDFTTAARAVDPAFSLNVVGGFDTVMAAAETRGSAASETSKAGGTTVLLCIFAFIAAHAVGQGAVIWVFIGEIFPNRSRAFGQTLGSFTHWIFAALITLFFPIAMSAFAPGYVFAFFCFMMVLQLVWVKAMVPETKGVPLEEMQKKLGITL